MGKQSVDIESPEERVKDALYQKDIVLYQIKQSNEKLYRKVEKLEERLYNTEQVVSSRPSDSGTYLADGPNPSHITKELSHLSNNTTGFVRNFVNTLKNGGADLKIINQLNPNPRSVDTGYLQRFLASFLNHHLFLDFENERFKRGGSTFLDVSRRKDEYFKEWKRLDDSVDSKPSTLFDEFVNIKWESFKKSLAEKLVDKKDLILKLVNGNDSLRTSFETVAMAAWKLHRLSFSFNSPATIIRVEGGTSVDRRFVKLHTYFEEQWEEKEGGGKIPITDFMIFPGFQVQSTVIPCRVYPEM